MPSRHDTLVLCLPEPDLHTADEVAAKLVGAKCYVNWPYLVEAIVVGASDVNSRVSINIPSSPTPSSRISYLGPNQQPPPSNGGPSSNSLDVRSETSTDNTIGQADKKLFKTENTTEASGFFKKVSRHKPGLCAPFSFFLYYH